MSFEQVHDLRTDSSVVRSKKNFLKRDLVWTSRSNRGVLERHAKRIKMGFDIESLSLLVESLKTLDKGFSELPDFNSESDLNRMREVLDRVAIRMRDNFPYHHP